MIARINGKLIHKSIESVIIDVNGVGYEIVTPLSTYYKLPDLNETAELNIYTHHRDDSIELYGFLSPQEKEAFKMLIGVSGIGPRLARNILSGISVDDFAGCIAQGDVKGLRAIPGLGAKTSERLIVELRDKVGSLGAKGLLGQEFLTGDPVASDVLSALTNLGYKGSAAREAVSSARSKQEGDTGGGAGGPGGADGGFEALLKAALKFLTSK